jgi:hypothetical protein
MAGEEKDIPLREYVEKRLSLLEASIAERFNASKEAVAAAFNAQKQAIDAALAAADRAVTKAELATEKRFESVNEFRGTLDNQQRTLIPRSEVDVLMRSVEEKVSNIQKQLDAQVAERQGLKGGWGYAVGVVGFLLTIGSLVMVGIKFVIGK